MTAQTKNVFTGIGVGLNPAVGEVLVVENRQIPAWTKSSKSQSEELAELEAAIAFVGLRISELGKNSNQTNAAILDALKALLQDDELLQAATKKISEGWSAAAAFAQAVNEFSELLKGDRAFEERIADFQDLSKRVQARLAGIELDFDLPETGNFILVGEDFSPLDTAKFTKGIIGVITFRGGPTSHTAIICKSKGIPAVVSCPAATALTDRDTVLVDPVGDRVVLTADVSLATATRPFVPITDKPIVSVRVNIGDLADAVSSSKTKANGVGLFRTELLYLGASAEPSLEQQVESYIEIMKAAPAGPFVVRTLDSGGDKPVPFLRSVSSLQEVPHYRLLAEHKEFLEVQLRALELARKKSGREVWVMAPMISGIGEAKEFAELARSIGEYRVGIMIETPAIALLVDQLAGLVDFVSIGTNDLANFLFGSNRMDQTTEQSLSYWEPLFIKTLAKVASEAKTAGIDAGVCGESASDPVFAILLAGLGFDSVSVSGSSVNEVRSALSSMTMSNAQEVAGAVLEAATAKDARLIAFDLVTGGM